jgi:hypothetical protein
MVQIHPPEGGVVWPCFGISTGRRLSDFERTSRLLSISSRTSRSGVAGRIGYFTGFRQDAVVFRQSGIETGVK